MKQRLVILLLFLTISSLFGQTTFYDSLSSAAIDLTNDRVVYDPAYYSIEYPGNWGLTRTDKNIDHRRVPNLMVFFAHHGEEKIISCNPDDYLAGDIVCWDLGGGITHIGIVVDKLSGDGKRNLVVHNIGGGQVLADCLFDFEVIGHYRYK